MKTDHVSAEELLEAIEVCHGIIGSCIQYIREKFNLRVNRAYLQDRIKEWNMSEFLHECRRNGVEKCLLKMFSKGIDEGSDQAIKWMLEKYGQHCDFLSEREASGLESCRGDILKYYDHLHDEYTRKDREAVTEANREYNDK